jgi:hypothetical protein
LALPFRPFSLPDPRDHLGSLVYLIPENILALYFTWSQRPLGPLVYLIPETILCPLVNLIPETFRPFSLPDPRDHFSPLVNLIPETFRPFSLHDSRDFYIIWLSNLLTLIVLNTRLFHKRVFCTKFWYRRKYIYIIQQLTIITTCNYVIFIQWFPIRIRICFVKKTHI